MVKGRFRSVEPKKGLPAQQRAKNGLRETTEAVQEGDNFRSRDGSDGSDNEPGWGGELPG